MPITSLDLDAHLSVAGTPAASFARLWRILWKQPYVSPGLLEMCRLTLARLHRDVTEIAAENAFVPGGLTPEQRKLVLAGKAARSEQLSNLEKAVLDFTETYGLDPQSLTDAQAAEVASHIGESGLVFLIEALGCLDGRIRVARCLRGLTGSGGSEAEHVR